MSPPSTHAPTQQALDVFACPLTGTTLIEASAGTGKTWAITGLVLRLVIERGLPIQEILVVTFTKAATAELRERIRDRLRDVLTVITESAPSTDPFIQGLLTHSLKQVDSSTAQRRLEAALAMFDEAAIYTIHGYCQRALGDAPLTAGQPFELTLGDDQRLCRELATDFWRTTIATLNDPLLASYLAKTLSPALLEAQLRRRLNKPLATLRWPNTPNTSAPSDDTLATLFLCAKTDWLAARETTLQMLLGAADAKMIHGASYKAASIHEGANAWTAWFAAEGIPDTPPPSICERWCLHLLEAKTNKGKTTPSHPLFVTLDTLWTLLIQRDEALRQARLRLLRDFLDNAPAEMQRRKRTQRQASFDDLLGNLHRALTSDSKDHENTLAHLLARRYPVALIDEFQDTDPLQFDIFKRIYIAPSAEAAQSAATTPALFLVGDPKQAIYSFRQADLQTYLQARDHAEHRFYLPDNQRSSAALITAVNTLFSQHPQPFMLPGLTFQSVGKGQKKQGIFHDTRSHNSLPPTCALHCWQLPSDEPLDKSIAQQRAAEVCAHEMAALLAGAAEGKVHINTTNEQDSPCSRPVVAGDLAVLVRTNEQGRRMKAALANVGLAAAELSTGSVFASPEAAELELLLLALAEPGRLERIRAALATLWLGLNASDIAELAELADEKNGAELSRWLLRFQQAQQRWLRQGLAVSLHRLLSEWGISSRLLSLAEGERKLTNIVHLIELLHEYEKTLGKVDSSALLRWLGKQRAEPYAMGEAAQLRLESDEKLVRIVTIHRSKGLEYPVVFCPFIWEGPGKAKESLEGVEYPSADAGRCIDFRDPEEPERISGRLQAELEEAAEHLRLLYVALTRAVHRCYLVTGPYLFNRSINDSQRALLNWLVAGHDNPAGWVQEGGNWDAIHRAWHALTDAVPAISQAPLPPSTPPGAPALASNITASSALRRTPPTPPAHLPLAWRIDSFTGLLRGAHLVSAPTADRDAPIVSSDDILLFERGARAGECIHAVFEHANFSDPSTWPDAIAAALQMFPPLKGTTDLSAQRLHHMLADVLNTPLPAPSVSSCSDSAFPLSSIPITDRLCELEFSLPVGTLSATTLNAICRRYAIPVPDVVFSDLTGYLRGFIDLVFRVGETLASTPLPAPTRYYLLDWKSNYLGDDPEHYSQSSMQNAMASHGYYLQALIYCFALHRHLRLALPDYDPAQHLGGAYYLFVRGVRPDWPRDNGFPTGVVHWQPSLALLHELDSWFTADDA